MKQRIDFTKKASLLVIVVGVAGLMFYQSQQDTAEPRTATQSSLDAQKKTEFEVSPVAPEQATALNETVEDAAQGIEICDSSGEVYIVEYPFNFAHTQQENGVGLWLQQMVVSLETNDLEWPKRSIDTDDYILNHNLSKREAQVIGRIQDDPHGAVELMRSFIEQEESKFVTRELMSVLHDSMGKNNGAPSDEAYAEALANISDRYFVQVVQLGLREQQQAGLGLTALEHALQRDEPIRVKSLAHLIKSPNVAHETKGKAATELADALNISYSPDQLDTIDWSGNVDTYLARLD